MILCRKFLLQMRVAVCNRKFESPPVLLLESISRKILGKVHLVSSQTKDTNKLVCISFIILQYFCLNEKYVTYALRITQNTTEKGAELLPYFTSRA